MDLLKEKIDKALDHVSLANGLIDKLRSGLEEDPAALRILMDVEEEHGHCLDILGQITCGEEFKWKSGRE